MVGYEGNVNNTRVLTLVTESAKCSHEEHINTIMLTLIDMYIWRHQVLFLRFLEQVFASWGINQTAWRSTVFTSVNWPKTSYPCYLLHFALLKVVTQDYNLQSTIVNHLQCMHHIEQAFAIFSWCPQISFK